MAKWDDSLKQAFASAEAAGEYEPLPPGDYDVEVFAGKLGENRNGTPLYKLTLEVTAGEFTGRRVWHDVYLTGSDKTGSTT
jgi:hypothetical protein